MRDHVIIRTSEADEALAQAQGHRRAILPARHLKDKFAVPTYLSALALKRHQPSMEDQSKRKVIWAMVDAVHSMLERNREATIPGLGTFRVAYERSRCERQPDGSTVIVPPRRNLSFTPVQEDAAADG